MLQFTVFEEQCLAQRFCKLSEKVLTVKNNDNWIFLIFFVFAIVFPLELETRFHSLSITITTDTSPTQMDCSRIRK